MVEIKSMPQRRELGWRVGFGDSIDGAAKMVQSFEWDDGRDLW